MKGNRKFYVVMAALAGATMLALLSKLTSDYAMIAGICVGAFAAANTFEHKYGQQNGDPPSQSLGDQPK